MVALLVLDDDDDDDDSADSAKADADAKSTSATTKIRSVGGSGEEETLAVVAGGIRIVIVGFLVGASANRSCPSH